MTAAVLEAYVKEAMKVHDAFQMGNIAVARMPIELIRRGTKNHLARIEAPVEHGSTLFSIYPVKREHAEAFTRLVHTLRENGPASFTPGAAGSAIVKFETSGEVINEHGFSTESGIQLPLVIFEGVQGHYHAFWKKNPPDYIKENQEWSSQLYKDLFRFHLKYGEGNTRSPMPMLAYYNSREASPYRKEEFVRECIKNGYVPFRTIVEEQMRRSGRVFKPTNSIEDLANEMMMRPLYEVMIHPTAAKRFLEKHPRGLMRENRPR